MVACKADKCATIISVFATFGETTFGNCGRSSEFFLEFSNIGTDMSILSTTASVGQLRTDSSNLSFESTHRINKTNGIA